MPREKPRVKSKAGMKKSSAYNKEKYLNRPTEEAGATPRGGWSNFGKTGKKVVKKKKSPYRHTMT